MPKREEMPAELAAMTVPPENEGDENPTVVLNVNEEDLRGVYRDFRPAIIIPVLLGLFAEKPAQVIRHHQVASAVAATAVVTSAVLVGVDRTLDRASPPLAQPTHTMMTITLPPTATATHRPEPSPARTTQPSPTAQPSSGPTTRPSQTGSGRSSPDRSRSAEPTREPTRPNDEPTRRRTSPPSPSTTRTATEPRTVQQTDPPPSTRTVPEPTTTVRPAPSPDPPRPEPDPPTAAPTTASRDCLIGVRVNPLLDVCVG